MKSMLYPNINHINDLLPFIEGNKQFRVAEQPNGTSVVCYMVKDEDTFRGEHAFWYQECRGITFGPDGSVVSRTLHKFPNVGENAESQHWAIDWTRVVRIMDKRDGSMITPVLLEDGRVVCKTKKTFTSNEAIAATEFMYKDLMRVEWVRALLQNGITPIFEWTSPKFPIVLLYEKDELTLLHMRENKSGAYLSEDRIRFLMPMANQNLFPIVEDIKDQFSSGGLVMWSYLERMALDREGIEGVIVQLDDGQMYKVKTKWYCDLHHSVTFTRYRDVARTVLEDKSDDLKAAFALTGRDIEPIIEIERVIFDKVKIYEVEVGAIVEAGLKDDLDAKAMALMWKEDPLFGQIMSTFRGKKIDWLKFYLMNHIRDHSLEVIPQAGMDDLVEEEEA